VSACPMVTFHGVTAPVFACLRGKLEAVGIHVPLGNSGTISGHGITALFNWDGSANLQITVTNKPLIYTCGEISGKIHDFVHSCGGQ
jgi:hypothetical protein